MFSSGVFSTTRPELVLAKGGVVIPLIYHIPVRCWLEYFALAQQIAPFTISVGSGRGQIESFCQSKLDPIPIFIPIDPAPLSYNYDDSSFRLPLSIPPMFNVVDELIELNPRLIGHVNLALIWPNPDRISSHPYDMEAIKKLRPRAIFTLIGADSSAGSKVFHRWLKSQTEYTLVRRCSSIMINDISLFCHPDQVIPCLMVLIRNDCVPSGMTLQTETYYTPKDFDLAHQKFDENAFLAKLSPAAQSTMIYRRITSYTYLLGKAQLHKKF